MIPAEPAPTAIPEGMHEAARREKMRKLQELGVDPWGGRFDDHTAIQSIRDRAGEIEFRAESGATAAVPQLPTEEFRATRLGARAMESAEVDLFYVCDPQGRVLWGRIVDPETKEPIRLHEMPTEALNPAGPLGSYPGEDHVSGLMMTERWPLLVCSYAISDAAGRAIEDESEHFWKPLYGTVILGRFLDASLLDGVE